MIRFYERHMGLVIWTIIIVFAGIAVAGLYVARVYGEAACKPTPRPEGAGTSDSVRYYRHVVLRSNPACRTERRAELEAERVLRQMREGAYAQRQLAAQ